MDAYRNKAGYQEQGQRQDRLDGKELPKLQMNILLQSKGENLEDNQNFPFQRNPNQPVRLLPPEFSVANPNSQAIIGKRKRGPR